MVKKDVAPGQNFSRFSPLTKITVFRLIRNPMLVTGKIPSLSFSKPSSKVFRSITLVGAI
jgi:hypothetical protein